ncbi:hypothetical protein [Pontibacterium sp.]|uniref:hypothetical protein n=1 Tax=Pontibacterium sp. TaxID=2036026 RepID=UPI0035181FF7
MSTATAFVSTWVSYKQDGDNWGVFAQRFDDNGQPIGAEFQVNTTTANNQSDPTVAMLLDGGFIVTWVDSDADGSDEGVFAQRYDADGNTVGVEFQVNDTIAGIQYKPHVTGLDDGGYVISWTAYDGGTSNYNLYAQRYDKDGVAYEVTEYKVNTEDYNQQFDSQITAMNDGGYLVSWTSYGQDGRGWGVFAQQYDKDNQPDGAEFRVNTYETNNQAKSSVTRLDDGGYIVVWSSYGQGGLDAVLRDDIYGQRYDANSNPVGSEFKINTHDADIQRSPVVAATGDGGYIVAWASEDQDGDRWGIYAQKFDSSNNTVGNQFLVNTETYAEQYEPAISATENGGVVITWTSDEQDGHANGIFGQMFDQDATPVGSEFQINDTSYHVQQDSSVGGFNLLQAGGGAGDAGFVVTWLSFRQDGNEDWAVYAQRYDKDGNPEGDEFLVSTFDYGNQTAPQISALSDGGFVITWVSNEQDGGDEGIFGQRYNAQGEAMGGEFQINSFTKGIQYEPAVTGLENGGFVVTWSSYAQDGRGYGVFGQNFDEVGNPVGDEYQINTYTFLQQDESTVTALVDGGYVVTWTSYGQDGRGDGIYGQRFDEDGNKVGTEFQANSHIWNNQNHSDIAALSNGGFIITWTSDRQDGSQTGIYAQQYDVNGDPEGGEMLVNTTTQGYQSEPAVTGLEGGGYVISWDSFYGEDGDRSGVYAQMFDAHGDPKGGQFLVNTYTDRDQEGTDISALSDGGFVVTWSSDRNDGSEEGIFGQRYDADGNAVGDEFQVNSHSSHIQMYASVTGLKAESASSATAAPQPKTVTVDGAGNTTVATDQSFHLYSLEGEVSDLELLTLEGSEVTQVAVSLDALLNLTDGDNTLTVTGDSGDKVLLLGDGWVQGEDTVVNGTAAETFSNGGAIVIVEEELDVLSNYSNILPDNF